jgi:hypothetical protein
MGRGLGLGVRGLGGMAGQPGRSAGGEGARGEGEGEGPAGLARGRISGARQVCDTARTGPADGWRPAAGGWGMRACVPYPTHRREYLLALFQDALHRAEGQRPCGARACAQQCVCVWDGGAVGLGLCVADVQPRQRCIVACCPALCLCLAARAPHCWGRLQAVQRLSSCGTPRKPEDVSAAA